MLDRLKRFALEYYTPLLFFGSLVAMGGYFSAPDLDDYRFPKDASEHLDYIADKIRTAETERKNLKLTMAETWSYQLALQTLGYNLGKCGADGFMGAVTTEAISAFQETSRIFPADGAVNSATLFALSNILRSDPSLLYASTAALLQSAQGIDYGEFKEKIGEVFSLSTAFQLSARPDLMAIGAIELFRVDANPTPRYPGCENEGRNDALRHTYTMARIGDYYTYEAARKIGDAREVTTGNTPVPEMLMDVWNHRAAVELLQQPENQKKPRMEIIENGLNSGILKTRPFPVIPADFFSPHRTRPNPVMATTEP